MPRILVFDGDLSAPGRLGDVLRREGFEVVEASEPDSALDALRADRVELAVLDLDAIGVVGFELLRQARQATPLPLVAVTERAAEVDRVLGLELGADDYLTKPFSEAELASRIRAILRRRSLDGLPPPGAVRVVGDIEVDLARHQARVGKRLVRLTPSELRILALLAERPDEVVSRREIMTHLWNSSFVADEHACVVHVSNLRRKIEGDSAAPKRLVTVRGAGYKLVSELR